MAETIISIGLLILYVGYVKIITHFQDIKIKENEQRIYELAIQLEELKEDIYINK